MAVDEEHAERIRAVFDELGQVPREQRMFGGMAWMVQGNMAVGTWDDGGLMVRVGADGLADALADPHVGPVTMGERTMGGFVVVEAAGISDDSSLRSWVERGVAFALSLPPK